MRANSQLNGALRHNDLLADKEGAFNFMSSGLVPFAVTAPTPFPAT